MKKRLQGLACLLALGPILPLFILRQGLMCFVDLIDICTSGRAWAQPFINASERLERHFRLDPESEHEAWRERMGFNRDR